jgi:hypothetical protein
MLQPEMRKPSGTVNSWSALYAQKCISYDSTTEARHPGGSLTLRRYIAYEPGSSWVGTKLPVCFATIKFLCSLLINKIENRTYATEAENHLQSHRVHWF